MEEGHTAVWKCRSSKHHCQRITDTSVPCSSVADSVNKEEKPFPASALVVVVKLTSMRSSRSKIREGDIRGHGYHDGEAAWESCSYGAKKSQSCT